MDNTNSIQNDFLNMMQENSIPVAVYLTNGIKLQGTISDFDQSLILLKNKANIQQVVYKHAMASILPMRMAHPDPMHHADSHAYQQDYAEA